MKAACRLATPSKPHRRISSQHQLGLPCKQSERHISDIIARALADHLTLERLIARKTFLLARGHRRPQFKRLIDHAESF